MAGRALLIIALAAVPRCKQAPPAGAPVEPHPGVAAAFPVVEAASCAGHGTAVAPAAVELTRDARGRWITRTPFGCGCPTGPVFTLAYVRGTAPLEARLCLDQRRDPCERGCAVPIAWDLDAPMKASRATALRLVP